MSAVRRWYVFIVCAVSLQAVTWSVIALLRGVLVPGIHQTPAAAAFRIAVIIVGLPIFLAHWLWQERSARREPAERKSAVRYLYLYVMLASFLASFVSNGFYLVRTVLFPVLGRVPSSSYPLTRLLLQNLIAMIVLALLWLWHQRILAEDSSTAPAADAAAPVRRLYAYGFSITGLTLMTLAFIRLLGWLMFQIGPNVLSTASPTSEVTRLLVGAGLWLVFWRWAGRLFHSADAEERGSALRKVYLYAVVFVAVLLAVGCAAAILAGLFRRLLDLPSSGDIRTPLSIIVGMAALWAYHAYVLRVDAAVAGEAPRQSGVRRIYLYLMAGIGLAALLIGFGGDLSVLIRSVSGGFLGTGIKQQLAWFTAALIAGLPVWLLSWRLVQAEAAAAPPAGSGERHALTRRIYLYFYLGVAALTVLSSLVFVVSRLLAQVLGAGRDSNLISNLAQALAFSLVGIGVWICHALLLRGDSRLNRLEWTEKLAAWRVAVVEPGTGQLGRALLDHLKQELPGLVLDPVGLTPAASAAMNANTIDIVGRLSAAQVIVGPWMIAAPGTGAEGVSPEIAAAVATSPARKILIPARAESWEWAGVDFWKDEALARQVTNAVRQAIEGKPVKPVRPLGAGAIIAIVLGVLIGLPLLAGLIYAAQYARYIF